MYPELFQIHSYSFFLWVACIAMTIGAYVRSRNVLLSTGLLLVALAGARILHILTNLPVYQQNPGLMFAFDAQGLSLYGSIIAVSITGLIISVTTRLPVWKLSDDMVPYITFGLVAARIGCFLNGCSFGKVTNLPWAVRFPLFSDAHMYQISQGETNLLVSLPVHPTQAYEAIGAILAMLVARLVQKKTRVEGAAILAFTGTFSVVRLLVYNTRVFPESYSGVAPYFPIVYLIVILLCLFVFRYRKQLSQGVFRCLRLFWLR